MLISLHDLIKKYNFNIKGIIHIGASYGQEMPVYAEVTDGPVVFIEAIPEVFRELQRRMRAYPQTICLNACITDVDGEQVSFNVSNNEMQSSSLFEFGTHTLEHPSVRFERKINLQTTTVDSLFKVKQIDYANFDFLNIDLQGAELLALKSMDLSHIKYAYLEVNEKPLYYQCPLIDEIDSYMHHKGFKRVQTNMTSHGWGDAFYVRREANAALTVPILFQPHPPSFYPSDNAVDFEHWYHKNYTPHLGRVYLPIMWTAFYCRAKYGQDAVKLAALQQFLNSLDRSLKYYTIIQYDDGILNDVSHLDLKVFSMSGKPMHYPLPLICQPHDPVHFYNNRKDFYASFVGRETHPIRSQLKQFETTQTWFIRTKMMHLAQYCEVLTRSIFTLCPRGYGPTSFRIMEALQFGSIPVYISDEFIEPHGVDFNTYGIKVSPEEIAQLPQILSRADIPALKQAGQEIYKKHYTYESNKRYIDHHCTL